MSERYALIIGRIRGAPVMLHWSLLLGLLAFGGFRFVPGFWLGFTLLILAHELGHAYLVRRLGHQVHAVVVHGFGGFCRWDGQASRLEHSIIAWGGVLAQALLLGGTLLATLILGPPESLFTSHLHDAFIRANVYIMVLNLLPIPPLDGAEAWHLFRAMRVESVSFSQVMRRCLPFLPKTIGGRPRPGAKAPAPTPRAPREKGSPRGDRAPDTSVHGDAKPSADAQRAIADALRRIADQAGEARKKK